jgi:hypothetical protein
MRFWVILKQRCEEVLAVFIFSQPAEWAVFLLNAEKTTPFVLQWPSALIATAATLAIAMLVRFIRFWRDGRK